jgi:hypothetical protein
VHYTHAALADPFDEAVRTELLSLGVLCTHGYDGNPSTAPAPTSARCYRARRETRRTCVKPLNGPSRVGISRRDR